MKNKKKKIETGRDYLVLEVIVTTGGIARVFKNKKRESKLDKSGKKRKHKKRDY